MDLENMTFDITEAEHIDLESLSIAELDELISSAEKVLHRMKSDSQRSLQSDLTKLARQAGLSADDLSALFS